MKNAAIFGSGVAVGVAGFAIFSVGLIGFGLMACAFEINRSTNGEDNLFSENSETQKTEGLTVVE